VDAGDVLAEPDDGPRHLVSEYARKWERDVSLLHVEVAVADAAGGHPDEDLARSRDRVAKLLDDERPQLLSDDGGSHGLSL